MRGVFFVRQVMVGEVISVCVSSQVLEMVLKYVSILAGMAITVLLFVTPNVRDEGE